MMNLEIGMKLKKELILVDTIVYYVEPVSYYDDGSRKLYKFVDEDNNIYVWKTTKAMGVDYVDANGNEGFEFANEGDMLLISGTVKDVSEFRGEEQIVLTRCKIMSIIQHNFIKNEDDLRTLRQKLQLARFKDYQIKTVKYRDYKESYTQYETLIDSFIRNDNGAFIDVIIA